jgi:hypothetical protein
MKSIVFYSWQSDLPNATNRGFIQQALDNVARAITADKDTAERRLSPACQYSVGLPKSHRPGLSEVRVSGSPPRGARLVNCAG